MHGAIISNTLQDGMGGMEALHDTTLPASLDSWLCRAQLVNIAWTLSKINCH